MGQKLLGGFIVGGIVGAVAGILYAPRSGAETRALLADKVDEYWGEGRDLYERGVQNMNDRAADFVPAAAMKSDELREKIDAARERIATQVAKNAAAACDTMADAEDVVVDAAVNVGAAAYDHVEAAVAGVAAATPPTEPAAEPVDTKGDAAPQADPESGR